jgi:hypothetical protein
MDNADKLRQEVTDKMAEDAAAAKAAEAEAALQRATVVREAAEEEYRKIIALHAEREAVARKAVEDAVAAEDDAKKDVKAEGKAAPAKPAETPSGGLKNPPAAGKP